MICKFKDGTSTPNGIVETWEDIQMKISHTWYGFRRQNKNKLPRPVCYRGFYASSKNAKLINQIVNGNFDITQGYEYYIESEIMSTLKLNYSNKMKGQGCIAMMVSQRRTDTGKNA